MNVYYVLVTDRDNNKFATYKLRGKRKLIKFILKYGYRYKMQLI